MADVLRKGIRTLSSLTLLSRVLGMARDAALAYVFGTGTAMNAYSVAFALPNLFRRLFGEGALSAAFIPVFTGLIEQGDERAARRLANLTITLLVAVLAALVLMGEGIILLMSVFTDGDPRFHLTLGLAAVMLPFVVTICLVALLQGVLNVRGHFARPALAPIVLNLFIIAGALLSAPLWGGDQTAQVYGVAVSVLLAGLVQVAVQVPALRRHGFRFQPVWDTASPQLRRMLKLMLPMIVGLGIVQINTFVDQLIAMGFSDRTDAAGNLVTQFELWGRTIAYPMKRNAVSVMYYGQRLFQLPFGVFTVAIGTAIFPVLSRHAHHDDRAGLAATLNRGLRLATFIALPCMVGMILVATPLVRAIFERGRFDRLSDTPDVALMATVYVAGLLSYSVLHLVTRTFFAMQEALTPVKTAVAAAALNFVLNVTLIWLLGIAGLAVSTAVAATAQGLVLLWLLRRRIGRLGLRSYVGTFWRCCVATAAMGAAAWGAMRAVDLTALPPGGMAHAVAQLAAAVTAGTAVYLLAARLLRMRELADLLSRTRAAPPDAGEPGSA